MFSHYTFGKTTSKSRKFCQKQISNQRRCQTQEEIPFTLKQDVEFDNSKQKVSFMYVKGSPYKIGTHTIEVYHEGNKIGESTLVVK